MLFTSGQGTCLFVSVPRPHVGSSLHKARRKCIGVAKMLSALVVFMCVMFESWLTHRFLNFMILR